MGESILSYGFEYYFAGACQRVQSVAGQVKTVERFVRALENVGTGPWKGTTFRNTVNGHHQ